MCECTNVSSRSNTIIFFFTKPGNKQGKGKSKIKLLLLRKSYNFYFFATQLHRRIGFKVEFATCLSQCDKWLLIYSREKAKKAFASKTAIDNCAKDGGEEIITKMHCVF